MASTTDTTDEKPWAVEETAAFLGVTSKTVYRWAAAGAIPSVRLGRSLKFIPASLRAWREKQERGGK